MTRKLKSMNRPKYKKNRKMKIHTKKQMCGGEDDENVIDITIPVTTINYTDYNAPESEMEVRLDINEPLYAVATRLRHNYNHNKDRDEKLDSLNFMISYSDFDTIDSETTYDDLTAHQQTNLVLVATIN